MLQAGAAALGMPGRMSHTHPRHRSLSHQMHFPQVGHSCRLARAAKHNNLSIKQCICFYGQYPCVDDHCSGVLSQCSKNMVRVFSICVHDLAGKCMCKHDVHNIQVLVSSPQHNNFCACSVKSQGEEGGWRCRFWWHALESSVYSCPTTQKSPCTSDWQS